MYPSSPDRSDQTGVMLLHQYAKCWGAENEILVINPHSYNILTGRKLRRKRLLSHFELDGITVYNEPILRLPGDFLQVGKFQKIVSQLGSFDLIIGCLPVGLEIAHHVSSKLKVPYFAYLHNTDFHRSGLSKGTMSRKYKRILSQAVGVMYVSPKLRDAFEKEITLGGILLSGGISDNWLKNRVDRSSNKIASLRLITSGRLVKQKNIDAILLALSTIENGFNLVIAGGGQHRDYLEEIVSAHSNLSEKVVFTGMVDHNRMMQLFDQNDFMILLSTNESFGLVYLEAMARGCIPIGTKGEGIDGVIQHGKNGFLCDPDPNSIRKMLMKISDLPKSTLAEISNAASQTAKNFVYDNLAKIFLDFAKTKLVDV